jgi:thiol-disulfide isomerase/thioredoxin
MKKIVIVSITFLYMLFAKQSSAQRLSILPFEDLRKMYEVSNDTTYIVHFFASWCAPCVKELPVILEFEKAHAADLMKIIYVSLDEVSSYKKSLLPFLEKLKLHSTVFMIKETDVNIWIPKIDANWSGVIPANFVINTAKNYKVFKAGILDKNELNGYLK